MSFKTANELISGEKQVQFL